MTYNTHAVLLAVFSSVLGSIATILLKIGSKKLSFNFLILKNVYLMSGAVLFIFSNLIFILALKWGDLSVLNPISAVGYLIVGIMSAKILNEKVSALRWTGIAFILFGAVFIGLSY